MLYLIVIILFMLIVFLFIEVYKEKRRNRILQSFLAGIIKSISDYMSKTDIIDISSASDIINIFERKFPIPYNELLENINKEFEKDFWINPYYKWVKNDRNIFYENKYKNDGFNMIYWDFFDKNVADLAEQNQINKKQKNDR
jgi:hypothetical protein